MKFLRKFDTFLLENYPILWRSKVFYLLATGALLWVVFYLVGYAITDLNTLLTCSIDKRYEDTYAVLFHAILVLIILSFWALHFYKKNAIRHYYPLKRFYLLKLFFSILIGILPLVTIIVPFQAGVRAKARYLVDLETLQKEIHTINLALAFLPTNTENYSIHNKTFPKPFPVSDMLKFLSDSTWTESLLYIKDSTGDTTRYIPANHPENTVVIDNKQYQFLHSKTINPEDECYGEYYELITHFYHPDTSLKLHAYGLLNYSNVEYSDAAIPNRDSYSIQYDSRNITKFNQLYAPKIHRWVHQKQQDSIQYIVHEFQEILNKYSINNVLNPQLIAAIHAHYDYHGNYLSFVNTGIRDKNDYEFDFSVNNENIISYLESEDRENPFAYNQYSLDYLIRNSKMAYHHEEKEELNLAFVVIAISLSLLFFLFDVTPFIQFLIAIPAMGVLMIALGLISALIDYNHNDYYFDHLYKEEAYIFLLFSITFICLIVFSWITIKYTYFNKKLSGVLLNMGCFVAPVLPFLVLLTIVEFSRHVEYNPCGGMHKVYNVQLRETLMDPYLLVSVSLLGALCYFPLIRKYYARKE